MKRNRQILGLVLAALLIGEIAAQIGPYPGGQYPGGRYPGGGMPGSGIPMPGRKKKTTTSKDTSADEQFSYVTGVLRKLEDEQLIVEAKDTRIINLKRTGKTKFTKMVDKAPVDMKPSDLKPGDHLLIEATQNSEGYFTAVNVTMQSEGTAAERADASRPVQASTQAPSGNSRDSDDERPRLRRADSPPAPEPAEPAPTPVAPKPDRAPVETAVDVAPPPVDLSQDKPLPAAERDPEDPGPPTLRRGAPIRKPQTPPRQVASAKAPTSTPPSASPITPPVLPADPAPQATPEPRRAAPEAPAEDPVIAKAKEAADSFTESLPNYICQQFTSRFVNTSHITNWQPQDVVSAEVVYENGRESYRNLAINGKAVKKGMEEMSGAWSTGEFGTLLRDLFSDSTQADFRYRRDSSIAGMTAAVYDYTVLRENSHWRVQVPSQSVFPAYRGSVWIDKKNGRVLRIEMQARNVPSEFPLDTIETAADYEYVRIGGTQQFLLPVHSETLMCQRGTNMCNRNTIDFRNYKKYSGDASITFDK